MVKTPLIRVASCNVWLGCLAAKPSWETGVILGLSERTVNFHLVQRQPQAQCVRSAERMRCPKQFGLGLLETLTEAPTIA